MNCLSTTVDKLFKKEQIVKSSITFLYLCRKQDIMNVIIKQIFQEFSDQLDLDIDISKAENIQKITHRLNQIDPNISQQILAYEKTINHIDFFKNEKEMRIKFPDIWKLELSRAKDAAETIKSRLLTIASKHQVNLQEIVKEFDSSM